MKRVLMSEDPRRTDLNPFFRIVFRDPAFLRAADVAPLGYGILPARAGNIHLHWIESLLHSRPARRSEAAANAIYWNLVRLIDRKRRAGGRLIWTVHNAAPHDFPNPAAARVFANWSPKLLARVDTAAIMFPGAEAEARDRNPALAAAKFRVIPHPHYRDFYRTTGTRESIRAGYDIPKDAFLVTSVGRIRTYKQLPDLLRAFVASARVDEYLLIAGACDAATRGALLAIAAEHPRIRFDISNIPDKRFADIVHDADVCVVNFGTILNSGSVIAALSLDTPVLAPAKGGLPHLQGSVGSAWLELFTGRLDGTLLRAHLDRLRAAPRSGSPDLHEADPAAVARAYLDTYA